MTTNIKYHFSDSGTNPSWIAKFGDGLRVFDGSPTIIEVSDAFFVPGSNCLYDRNGVRIPESCTRRRKGLTEYVSAGPVTASLPIDYITLNEPLIYLSFVPNHWGHFLTEGISRLWAPLEYPELGKIASFYLPTGLHLNSNITDFINLLGLKIHARGYSHTRSIKFRKIFIPAASFSDGGEAYSVHQKPGVHASNSHLHENHLPVSDQPVFLSRSRFNSKREIQNQLELESALARKRFLIVYPEELSLPEQILLFNTHRHFFGCWGSAFHTALLTRSPGRISSHIICHRSSLPNHLLVDSILGNDANYVESMFPVPGKEQVSPYLSLAIDVDRVLRYVVGIV